jgi:SulP family sulfate permease
MAGAILVAVGALQLGTFIKYVPHPVTVGFTAGIAVIIFASQVKELLGLTLPGAEPAAIVPKVEALWQALPTINLQAALVALGSIVVIVFLRRVRPHWPGFLIAVTLAALASFALGLDVETISSRFGGIPRSLPAPQLPAISLDRVLTLLPDALTVALLGGIESLLSAVVADSMTGRRHRSNCELVAQGIANIGCSIFGGLTATGTIARTATNVRSGAHGPVSGIFHAGFVFAFMAVAAPLAGYIPLAALAAILAVVSWNMAERDEFRTLLTASRGDALVLLATFLLVVFRDLTEGIVVGVILGCLLFMHRMAETIEVQSHGGELVAEDRADDDREDGAPYDQALATDKDIAVHRISGAFFFGAASSVSATLDRINEAPLLHILDFSNVPFVDSSAAHSLHGFLRKADRRGVKVMVAGASESVAQTLRRHGLTEPHVEYGPDAATCARRFRARPRN